MKLVRLFLKAFGPFSDRVLDLSTSPGNLHLVYGPNEAGKSSALRAMGDLRFGIPLRSSDSFLHPYERMRIGGAFLDGDGQLLGLVRHKGRGDTLSRCCPHSGETQPGEPVHAHHEAALTAGLSRSEFEALFGLDHPRLRQGGRDLIAGRGELGAALFEASAGTQGVSALLESLETEAKKLYSPRASTATINEARRLIEEARQGCKAALTRPAQWRALQRAHEEARDALAQAEQELCGLHHRLAELVELRTVAPLLRQQVLLEADCAALADAPELSPDAVEQRLRAEEALSRVRLDAAAARQDLQRACTALEALQVEDRVLELAPMVERLLALREQVAHGRPELQQLQAALANAQEEFALRTARIAPRASPAQLLAAAPSRADEAALQQRLEELSHLEAKLQLLRERQTRLTEALQAAQATQTPAPDPRRLQRLAEALSAAHALGDLPLRLSSAQQRHQQFADRLERMLHDLGLPDAEALKQPRPLLDAQIDAAGEAFAAFAHSQRLLEDERGKLLSEESAQQLRLRTLQASGEVATAASLREARRRRDEGWRAFKQACLQHSRQDAVPAPPATVQPSLATDFEAALAEADRQADRLHRDAERAAKVEECSGRLEQMGARRLEIAGQLADLDARQQAQQACWQQLLLARGLPVLGTEALRQWQARCQGARELALQLAEARQVLAELQEAGRRAGDALLAALGPEASGTQERPPEWQVLLARAQGCEQALRDAQSRRSAFEAAQHQLRREREAADKAIAELEAQQHRQLEALSSWHQRLLLPAGSCAAAVQARMQELTGLAALHEESASWRVRCMALEAQVQTLANTASDIARLLGDTEPAAVDLFVDQLGSRLANARAQAQQRELGSRDREAAQAALVRAEAFALQQEAVLARLCENAGGVARGELAGVQLRAMRKAQSRSALEQLRQQVAQASHRPPEELAQRIEGLDSAALELQRSQCLEAIECKEAELKRLREAERETRAALDAIDSSDEAAAQREALELAAARLRSAVQPWARLKLAQALLQEALRRFRERAQGPMLGEASRYFGLMTAGRYMRLVIDEREQGPQLLAEREDGRRVTLDAMSEGTADQLYLALRLAAQAVQRRSGTSRHRDAMPLVLDDVLMTSDDERAQNMLRALHAFSAHSQVLLFTHHRHLQELAAATLESERVGLHRL